MKFDITLFRNQLLLNASGKSDIMNFAPLCAKVRKQRDVRRHMTGGAAARQYNAFDINSPFCPLKAAYSPADGSNTSGGLVYILLLTAHFGAAASFRIFLRFKPS